LVQAAPKKKAVKKVAKKKAVKKTAKKATKKVVKKKAAPKKKKVVKKTVKKTAKKTVKKTTKKVAKKKVAKKTTKKVRSRHGPAHTCGGFSCLALAWRGVVWLGSSARRVRRLRAAASRRCAARRDWNPTRHGSLTVLVVLPFLRHSSIRLPRRP